MPQLVRSAFNRGGTWQSDGMDQGDNAAFQAGQSNRNQSLMAQLALAQLQSGDARFAAERGDRANELGMEYGFKNNALAQQGRFHDQDLAFQGNALDKQYGFLGQQESNANNRWQKGFDAEAPLREAQIKNLGFQTDLGSAQKDLALAEIARLKDQAEVRRTAGNAAMPIDLSDPDVADTYQQTLQATGDKGQAALNAKAAARGKAEQSAEALAQDAGVMGADITKRSDNWFFNKPGTADVQAAHQKRDELVAAFMKAGHPKAEAISLANNAILGQSRDNSTFNNWRRTLEQELGVRR